MSATSRNAPSSPSPRWSNRHPGSEYDASPAQASTAEAPSQAPREYIGSGRLKGKVALVTGGDRDIGRAAAVAFAKEGADIMIVYLGDHNGARITRAEIEREGRRCETLSLDMGREANAVIAVEQTLAKFSRLDILVNNATEQPVQGSLADISSEQFEQAFRSNIFAMFYLCKAAVPHLSRGARIINTTSVSVSVATLRGSASLLDYASTRGATVAFTRSLAASLASDGILVNGVAPGSILTSVVPSTLSPEQVERFGMQTPLGRPGQPNEVAGCYVFLASEDASYMTGQVLHPNGGEAVV